ncbi:MAG: hypothetical protein MJZ34_16395 [Paludibacteraceae bacterium]|nr:hypothetical protein [Paludibacteraceae bacterium]
MAHELNSMSTDITALMVWIAENVEPLQKTIKNQDRQIEELKKCSRCITCENIYKCKVRDIENEL